MSPLAKLKANVGLFGWRTAMLYSIGRVFTRLRLPVAIVRYNLVAQPVAEKPLLPPRRGRSIAVRQVTRGDPALAAMPLDERVLDFRFAQNAICFGAFAGEAMIGCLWLALDGYREDEIRARFLPTPPAEGAWDFDVYLLPEHRAGPGFARLWDTANGFLRERGVRWSVSRISAFNPGSIAAHARLGARPVAGLTAFCVGRWQLVWATIPPRLHVALRADAMPVYRIPLPDR